MDNIYTYIVRLPNGVHEVVMPCADGYTIYLSDQLDGPTRIRKYRHAIWHIEHDDFSKTDVQEIEAEAHEKEEHKWRRKKA